MVRRIFFFPIALIFCVAAVAADMMPAIFDSQFRSLLTVDPNSLLGQPIIHWSNDASRVKISFDELAEDNRYLRYRIVHCDSDWRPSEISEIEYVDGFNLADINSWAFSEHTLTHYVHYDLEIPNPDMRPLLSGNYLLQVFDQDDPDNVLLQTGFMVSEDRIGVAVKSSSRTDVDYNDRHQQLAVYLDIDGADIKDPFNELKVVIIQNGRPDTRRVLEKPLRVSPGKVIYEHQKELIFSAGNEYRRFDIANVRYPGMRVERYDFIDPFYHAQVFTDSPRSADRYRYDEDQAGRYFIDEINAVDPDIGADYVVTHFMLEMPRSKDDVFIDGDMVLRRRDSDSRMVWDESLGAYVKTMLLKQGLYNYQYITSENGANPIEGDYYETANEYLVLIYYKPHGARYDRLIGSGFINTGK